MSLRPYRRITDRHSEPPIYLGPAPKPPVELPPDAVIRRLDRPTPTASMQDAGAVSAARQRPTMRPTSIQARIFDAMARHPGWHTTAEARQLTDGASSKHTHAQASRALGELANRGLLERRQADTTGQPGRKNEYRYPTEDQS